ncbi:MAG: HlyD family efflux transporter periplasmic adaptor subunit [Planctomycetota bacterium]
MIAARLMTLGAALCIMTPSHTLAQEVVDEATDAVLVIENAQTSLIQNTKIAAPVAGIIERVDIREGDRVAIDAPLVRLNRDLAQDELGAAKAALEAATLRSENDVNLRYARRTLQVRENEMRQSEIANETYSGAVSQMELEEIALQVDQAALAIEQAQQELLIARATSNEKAAAVAIAQTNLSRHQITAPVAGMVTEVDVAVGEWVEAGKPMVRVISLDPLRVECFVDGREHGRELIGRPVSFRVKGAKDESVLKGKVSFVSPELQPVTGQVRLWATVENPRGIGSGLSGTLTVLGKKPPLDTQPN